MGNVLTTIPLVVKNRNGKGSLICAGHSVAPEKLPPGVMAVECHRCGRPVLLTQIPRPSDTPPPPPLESSVVPVEALEVTGATDVADGDITEGRTELGAPTGEISEISAHHISALDLSEISVDTGHHRRLSPPVVPVAALPPDETTEAQPPPLPDRKRKKKARAD